MHWTKEATNGLERIVNDLGQDKVDHMDWDLIHDKFVRIFGQHRTKKQLQEKWRNYLKSDVRLPDGERFVFSTEQINYIKLQRDSFGKSWAEIRDDLNKNSDMIVKTTPNRVKNAYHNATKKLLRHQRLSLSATVKTQKPNPNVHNEDTLAELYACNKKIEADPKLHIEGIVPSFDMDMDMDSEST
ncbi:26634_t:CDS:2, partial [Racocetra persica]